MLKTQKSEMSVAQVSNPHVNINTTLYFWHHGIQRYSSFWSRWPHLAHNHTVFSFLQLFFNFLPLWLLLVEHILCSYTPLVADSNDRCYCKVGYNVYCIWYTETGEVKCSCGQNVRVKSDDIGHIGNWPLFPLISLFLGDTGLPDEYLYFRVGPLVCKQGILYMHNNM